MHRNPIFRTRILRLTWLILLFLGVLGSLLPAQSAPMKLVDEAGVNDKVEHFTTYAVLTVLPLLGRFGWRVRSLVASLFLLGVSLEFGQLMVPGRSCDWRDVVANCCGIAAGVLLAQIGVRWISGQD